MNENQVRKLADRWSVYLMTNRCMGLVAPAWWPQSVRHLYVSEPHVPRPTNLTVKQMAEDYFVAWGIPPNVAGDMRLDSERCLELPVVGGPTERLALEAWGVAMARRVEATGTIYKGRQR